MAELIYNIGKDKQKMEIEFNVKKSSDNVKFHCHWMQAGNRITNLLKLTVPNIPKVTYYDYPISFLEKTIFINAETDNHDLDKFINAFFLDDTNGFYLRIMDNPYINEIKTLNIYVTATGF